VEMYKPIEKVQKKWSEICDTKNGKRQTSEMEQIFKQMSSGRQLINCAR